MSFKQRKKDGGDIIRNINKNKNRSSYILSSLYLHILFLCALCYLFLHFILFSHIRVCTKGFLFWYRNMVRPTSSELPIVRITTRICATHVHSYDRPRSTNAGFSRGKKVKERGEGRRKKRGGGEAEEGCCRWCTGRRYKEHYVQRRKTK